MGLDNAVGRTDARPMESPAAGTEAEVVVVGAGMVGLTLGCALAAAGIEVVVVGDDDPKVVTRTAFDGRVSAIAYASERALEALGLWSDMAGVAEPILEIRVSDADSPFFLHYDHRDVGDEPLGYIVENRVIRRALFARAGRLERLRLIAPARVAEVQRGHASVAVTLDGGERLRARLVVAADGRHSRLRRGAGIGVTAWTYPQTSIVCTVAHERPHRGIAHERFLPAGPFAILPMRGRRSGIVWTERAHLAPALLALDEPAFGEELALRFGNFLGELKVAGQRWSYRLGLVHAERYVAGRLALVGDAAHAIHPLAGQGFNLGLRDVAVLAEVLIDGRRLGLDLGDPGVLDRYERWRRFDSVVLIAATDGLNRLFSNDVAPVRLARDLGLMVVHRLPPARRFLMRHAMGLIGELPRLLEGRPL